MKRVLLLCTFSLAFLFSKTQIVFNEFYTDPNAGKHEFFELYNTSYNPTPIDLNSYTIVVYYLNASGTGFYVLDLPKKNIDPKKYFVGASSSIFNVQSKTNITADFSWNSLPADGSSSLKNWKKVADTPGIDADKNEEYQEVVIPNGFNDLFSTITGNSTTYAMMLFENGTYINGFLGGYNTTYVQQSIKDMPDLYINMVGGLSFTISWPSISLAENTTANGGSDNGYIRKRDGSCGSWVKSSSSDTHTPGSTNGIATELNGSLLVSNVYNCSQTANGESYVEVNVTGATGDATAGNTLPVEVQLYYDNSAVGQLGVLDGGDTYKTSLKFTSFTGASQSFVIPAVNRGQPIILVYKTVLGCFDKVVDLTPSCISLPVTFSNFHAQRSKQTVALKWETLSEQNNRGFNVQRNTKGVWETVAFVFSAADGGNSATKLSYEFNDANSEKGISQYRIQQVDMDGKASYSAIRSVKGLEQVATRTVVYPNPSADGKVSVVFEDQGAKAVVVSDMSGRIIRQYRNVLNNVQIEGLESGMYSVQVTDLSSAVSSTEKVIVKKR